MRLPSKITLIAFVACATLGMASAVTPAPKTVYGSWDSTSATSVAKGATVSVGGWAADTAAKPTPISGVIAKVFVDGVLVDKVEMGGKRPDVTDYYGFVNSGFTGMIDTSTLSLGEHTIKVEVGGGPSGWNHYDKPTSRGTNIIRVTEPKPMPVSPAKPVIPK